MVNSAYPGDGSGSVIPRIFKIGICFGFGYGTHFALISQVARMGNHWHPVKLRRAAELGSRTRNASLPPRSRSVIATPPAFTTFGGPGLSDFIGMAGPVGA